MNDFNNSILFTDSDSFTQILLCVSSEICHKAETVLIIWISLSQYSVQNILYVWLLFLFSDIICIFADDFSEVN